MSAGHAGGVYGSGLNPDDWKALRDVFWPFVHADDPRKVPVPVVPDRLGDHAVVRYVRTYRDTGDEAFLDKAGQALIPTSRPFGWYVPLTK